MTKPPAEREASNRAGEPTAEIKRPDMGPRPVPTTEARSDIGLQGLRQKIYITAKAELGWKRWSSDWIYSTLGLYNDYAVRYYRESRPSDRSHKPWRRSCQESPVPEIGTPGSLWRGMETRG
jgi:hypothetical protein